MNRRALALLTAVACCVAADAAAAQSGRARKVRERHRAATAIHQAWLQENLDLDTRGAIQSYEKVRRTAPPARPERWIAIARLSELARLGVTHPEPPPMPMQAPPEVQQALEALAQPVPWQRIVAAPTADVELPRLRPATEGVMLWGRDQLGPPENTRWMIRMRDRDPTDRGDDRWRNRNAAFTLLDVELESAERASALRRLMFIGWKPPVLEGDAAAALERARVRLRDWIASESSNRYSSRLTALQQRVEQLAENDPRDAVALLMRLPFLAEELLGDQPKPEDEADRDGDGRRERR